MRPELSLEFTSIGHLLVMHHHAISRRKLFPSPLSPVNMFKRLEKVMSALMEGPTFLNLR